MAPFRALSQVPVIRRFVSCACFGLLFLGCDGVQEDRRIEFTADGGQVAFQHGSDGIFVADPQSGELHKVFDPDPTVIAVSTPNWSDDETRAIFTTARDATRANPADSAASANPGAPASNASATRVTPTNWEDAPTGRLFLAQPIVYTCWLVERGQDGAIAKPVRLFDARCQHAGYVAANLAVRWDPKRKRVFFIERDTPLTHAVWIYDMEAKRKTRLFPPDGRTAAHVVFDLLGDGQHVVCVASGSDGPSAGIVAAEPNHGKRNAAPPNGSKRPSSVSGIWFASIEGSGWWHVPESRTSEQDNVPQGLSTLIAHRPVCSKDGRQFAFVGDEKTVKDSLVASLFRAGVTDKKVERVFTTAGDIRDVRWSPDGSRLGFVLVEPKASSFHIVDPQGHVQNLLGDRFVRDFAGWNATGDKMAVVVSEEVRAEGPPAWIDLLIPDPQARDAVLIADGKGAVRTIVSGMRFTFPQWSPKRDQLSMWGTFQPSHIAITEMAGGLGLRRGDPAAIVDASTGSIRWLAINGDEMAQVGNYSLLKHDPAKAREWYRKADKQLPRLEPLQPADLIQGPAGSAARRRTFEFFYSICLSKLGETKESAERLALFDKAYRIDWPTAPSDPAWSSESRRDAERLVAIAKALSVTQMFLSIDEPDAARTWFSQRLATAKADEKLACVLALSQLSRLAKQNREYAMRSTDQLAPLLITTLDDPPRDANARSDSPLAIRTALAALATQALGPLFSKSFLKQLPPDVVGQLVPKWEALRSRAHGRLASLYVDLFLRAAAGRLGHDKERMAAKARIAANPLSEKQALGGEIQFMLEMIDKAQASGHL
jgi:WD40-like Beta Propeller Repeat